MIISLRALLYRERRRLVLVASLAYLAGVLLYLPSPAYIGAVHISFVTGAVYAAVVGGAAILICALLPSMRFMMEAVAISRLLLALVILGEPALRAFFLGNPLIMAFVLVVGGVCISRGIHGRIEKPSKRLFQMRTPWQQAIVRQGTDWQRKFVGWVEGGTTSTMPLRA